MVGIAVVGTPYGYLRLLPGYRTLPVVTLRLIAVQQLVVTHG